MYEDTRLKRGGKKGQPAKGPWIIQSRQRKVRISLSFPRSALGMVPEDLSYWSTGAPPVIQASLNTPWAQTSKELLPCQLPLSSFHWFRCSGVPHFHRNMHNPVCSPPGIVQQTRHERGLLSTLASHLVSFVLPFRQAPNMRTHGLETEFTRLPIKERSCLFVFG
jgi:hypothetical protein